jgi:hypothetical protein
MVPELFEGLIKPLPGFRAALGYEYKNFRLALESGYTHIEGTNPLVLDLYLTPLVLKAGYSLPIKHGFGLQADLSCGRMFTKVTHYEDALNMVMDKKSVSSADSSLLGGRLYATWTTLRNILKFYAGGGADFIFETGGAIAMPVFEAGVSIKPLRFVKSSKAGTQQEHGFEIIHR